MIDDIVMPKNRPIITYVSSNRDAKLRGCEHRASQSQERPRDRSIFVGFWCGLIRTGNPPDYSHRPL